MGISAPFERAEFKDMVEDARNFYVSSIRQKAYIKMSVIFVGIISGFGLSLLSRCFTLSIPIPPHIWLT